MQLLTSQQMANNAFNAANGTHTVSSGPLGLVSQVPNSPLINTNLPANNPAPAPGPAVVNTSSTGSGSTGSGGGGGGTVVAGPTAAQIAAQQQAAAQAKLTAYLQDQAKSVLSGNLKSADVFGNTYNNQGNSLIEQIQQGQSGIDQARKGIAVNQINSINQLADTIREGLKGQQVSLANSNALDSSARDAVARIFAQYGNTQRNVINNGAAVQNDAQDTAQSNLELQRALGLNNLHSTRDSTIDGIVQTIASQLATLDGTGQLQGITGAFDSNALKQQVADHANSLAAADDQRINDQLGGIHALTGTDLAQKAAALVNAGTVSSGAGLPFQQLMAPTPTNGAPTAASIPLYLKPKQS